MKNPCLGCNGAGYQQNPNTGEKRTCPYCDGTGADSTGFPVPFWYPFKGQILTSAVPGAPPVLASIPVPIVQQIASEANFKWLYTLGKADDPDFVLVELTDLSSQFDFQQS